MSEAIREPSKACTKCGVVKPLRTGFNFIKPGRSYRNGGYRSRCRACVNAAMQERMREATEFIDAYKMERGCADCGWAKHPQALELDHRPGEDKTADVANMRQRSIAEISAEMEKCDVVCANCHRIRTFERRDFARNQLWDLRRREQLEADPPDPDLLSLLN